MRFIIGRINKINSMIEENLTIEHNGLKCKIIHFNKEKMIVDLNCFDKHNKFLKKTQIVFAQLPKKIKNILNPK